MLGGRLFWFCIGVGTGFLGSFWLKRRLKHLSFQRQIANRFRVISKGVSKEIRSVVSEGKEAIRLNGR